MKKSKIDALRQKSEFKKNKTNATQQFCYFLFQ